MFSLKNHARRGAKVVVIGAVASAGWAAVAHAANLTWDPGHTPATPSGGAGTFDTTTANFSNGTTDVVAAPTDDVHFATPGGTVSIPAGTFNGGPFPNVVTGGANVHSLSIDANGYTFGTLGASQIVTNGGDVDNVTILSLTAGNATVNADIFNIGGDFVRTQNINVAGGSTLTIHDLTNGSYGTYSSLRKIGTGALKLTGTLNTPQALVQLFINEGSVELAGQNNRVDAGITLESGTTLSGDAKIRITGLQKDYPSRVDIGLQTFTIKSGAHLAPGSNTSGNFGGVGTITTQSAYNNYISFRGNMQTNSTLDLDIASTSSYDSINLTAGAYSESRFIIDKGAKVNINAVNPLANGVYHIITGSQQQPYNSGLLMTLSDGGFQIGTAPAGFEYNFQDVITANGIGTRVTAVDLVVSTPTSGSTWTPANSTWSTDGNWVGGTNPNAAGTTATFAGNTTAAVNVDAPRTVGRILLSGTNYTFSGSTLTLDNTGGNGANATIRATSNSHTFNNSVQATGTDLDIKVGSGASLNFAGGVDNSLGRTVSLQNDGGTLTIASLNNDNANSIVNAEGDATVSNLSGQGKLLISAGTLTLSGANTMSGQIHLTGGKLSIGDITSLGTSNIFFRGGILRVTGTTLNNITGRIANPNSFIGFTGGFDIADPNNTFTVSDGLFSFGGGSLIKQGPGTLVLSGANALKGNVDLQQGIVRVTSTNSGYANFLMNGGTLGGSGSVSNAVLAQSTPSTVYPSAGLAAGTTSTLNVGRLFSNPNLTLKFNLVTPGASSSSDRINVQSPNRLDISSGGKLEIGSTSTGAASLGFYKAISYVTGFNGNVSSITLPPVVNNIDYYLDSVQDPNFIDIHRGFLGDANDDGVVNFADFVVISNHYGQANQRWPGGDMNHDGVTNFADFVILSNHYGNVIGGGQLVASPDELAAMSAFAAANVPEPASISLLAAGTLALLARRKRRN